MSVFLDHLSFLAFYVLLSVSLCFLLVMLRYNNHYAIVKLFSEENK